MTLGVKTQSPRSDEASVSYMTDVTEPRIGRVRGRSIFLTIKPWMDSLTGKELELRKTEVIILTI
jgi:hypothetical protein